MLAFRQFDTNAAAQSSFLGLSPPSKKSDLTPSKDPINKNMLYEPGSPLQKSGFKFDLQSVACRAQKLNTCEGGNKAKCTKVCAKNQGCEAGKCKKSLNQCRSA